MDVLFRLSDEVPGYETVEAAKKKLEKYRDDDYFDSTKPFEKFKELGLKIEGAKVYFALQNFLICEAVFTGEYEYKKEEKYPHFYQFRNWKVLDIKEKINLNIFSAQFPNPNFIDSEKKKQEIKRLLSLRAVVNDEEIENPNTFKEGEVTRRYVNAYERDPRAREECIAKYGYKCQVCSFDFKEKYGDIGEGFIHVHHLKPLAEVGEEYTVDPIRDLRPVCPNCHSMIHRNTKENPYSIEEMKAIIEEAKA